MKELTTTYAYLEDFDEEVWIRGITFVGARVTAYSRKDYKQVTGVVCKIIHEDTELYF